MNEGTRPPMRPIPPVPPPLPGNGGDPPGNSSKDRAVFISLIVFTTVLFLVGAGYLVVRYVQTHRTLGPRAQESTEQRYQAIRAGMAGQPSDAGAEAKPIAALFDDAAPVFRGEGSKRLDDVIDSKRMLQEIKRLGNIPEMTQREDQMMMGGLRSGLQQGFARKDTGWEKHELRSIQLREGGAEAVVYMRCYQDPGTVMRLRWWLTRTPSGWRIYDWEYSDAGLRVSTLMSSLLANVDRMSNSVPPWLVSFQQIPQVSRQIKSGEFDAALKSMDGITTDGMPPAFEALFSLMRATAYLGKQDASSALAAIDRAERLGSDAPMLLLLRARACNALGRFDEAAQASRKLLGLMGPDTNVYYELATAEQALGKLDEAEDAYRRGLAEDADTDGHLVGLVRTTRTPLDWDTIFRKSSVPKRMFVAAGEELVQLVANEEWAAARPAPTTQPAPRRPAQMPLQMLESMVSSYQRVDANEVGLMYYRARILMAHKKYRDAAKLLEQAMPRVVTPKARAGYEATYITAMVEAGDAMEAYRKAADPSQRFAALAPELLDREQLAALEQLIAAHRQKVPGDAMGFFYEGQLLASRKNPQGAVASFEKAMAAAGEDRLRQRIAWLWAPQALKAGSGLESYARMGHRELLMPALASHYLNSGNAADLEKLIAAHARAVPGDVNIGRWEAELVYLRKDYQGSVAKVRSLMAGKDKEQSWRLHEILVRSLIHLRQYDEALREAGDAPYDKVMVLAAAGRTSEAARILEKFIKDEEWDLDDLDSDPELGPLLKSPELKAVLDRYRRPGLTAPPPPAK